MVVLIGNMWMASMQISLVVYVSKCVILLDYCLCGGQSHLCHSCHDMVIFGLENVNSCY